MADPNEELVAAIDLGSNSFHMVIARQTGHDLQMLDKTARGQPGENTIIHNVNDNHPSSEYQLETKAAKTIDQLMTDLS